MDQKRAVRYANERAPVRGQQHPASRVRGTRPWGLLLGACLGLLAVAAPASAAETLLVLGVAKDGKADLKMSRQVQERLAHGGETVAPTARLTASERLCVAQDCLESLAAREQATLVLTSSVQKAGAGSYSIAALLYDVGRRKPFEAAGECERCMPETLVLRVGDLFERLLKEQRSRTAAEPLAQAPGKVPVVAAVRPSPAPAATATKAETETKPETRTEAPAVAAQAVPAAQQPQVLYPPRMQAVTEDDEVPRGLEERASPRRKPLLSLSPSRKIAAGVLGGIAGAALITAIALNVVDGQPTSTDCSAAPGAAKFCVNDYRALYGTGYALAGLSLVGLGVTLFWPSGEKTKTVAQRD